MKDGWRRESREKTQMIVFVLVINDDGMTRLARMYDPELLLRKEALAGELHHALMTHPVETVARSRVTHRPPSSPWTRSASPESGLAA